MQYSRQEFELLGKQVAAGHYVSRSTCILALILALLVGLCLGRYVFPASGLFASETAEKRPIGQGSAVLQQQQQSTLFQSILQHEEEVKQSPDNASAWEHLGNLYFDAGEPQKAVNAYNKVLELTPNNVNVLVDCGTMYRALGEFNKALEYFARALRLDPKHEHALFNSGIVLYYDLNRKQDALASWRTLVDINPKATAPNGDPIEIGRAHV